MVNEGIEERQSQLIDEAIAKIEILTGVDIIYFLDANNQIIKEKNNTGSKNYLEQVLNLINQESTSDKIGTIFYSKPFHTYTLLNETGLIVISKITSTINLYMIVTAGENEPVDLINLLKICKEVSSGFQNMSKTNV